MLFFSSSKPNHSKRTRNEQKEQRVGGEDSRAGCVEDEIRGSIEKCR